MIAAGAPGDPKMITTMEEMTIMESVVSEYSLKYLNKIVKLCKEEE